MKPFAVQLKLLPLVLCLVPMAVFAQGSLTPPGAPAPTMKSLDQIEARTPLAGGTAQVTISQPGSYYLTGNIAVTTGNAVLISASNVKLDLNGFILSSSASTAAGAGVALLNSVNSGVALSNIIICNGTIVGTATESGGTFSGGGFLDGIGAGIAGTGGGKATHGGRASGGGGGTFPGFHIFDMRISNCLRAGISIGATAVGVPNSVDSSSSCVESCVVVTVGNTGIGAGVVRGCSVQDCGTVGILADAVSDCRAICVGTGDAIHASVVTNSYGSAVGGYGVSAQSTVSNCVGNSYTGTGIITAEAQNAIGSSSSGNGLVAANATGCQGNTSSGTYGLQATSSATGCYGSSNTGIGLQAEMAINCHGVTVTGSGLHANSTATGCYGFASGAGTGLYAYIANVCHGISNNGSTTSIVSSHNINSF